MAEALGMRNSLGWVLSAALCAGASAASARAEDMRARWSFGFGAGVLSTKDDIRSNAAGLQLNEFGIPEDYSDDVPVDGSIDLRADDLLSRETSVQERQIYDFSVSYGLTSWLSLQFDVGRYSGDVANLDTFRVSTRYANLDGDGIPEDSDIVSTPLKDASIPISAGTLEQIPVGFSAVFRFRKDSPFNPILGAGVGMIFTDFEDSGAFEELNQEILRGFQRTQLFTDGKAWNTQRIEDRYGNVIASTDCTIPADNDTPSFACTLGQEQLEELIEQYPELEKEFRAIYENSINEEFIPTRPFITAEVDDAFEYHFMGGAEYHFNEHWSAYVVGRYTFTRANFRIRISDNGNLVTPNPTDDPSQAIRFDTDQAKFVFLSESNCDTNAQAETGCSIPPQLLEDTTVVQGGEINLSGFTLGFGLRVSF
jgi:opacity protein-like surface antigen